MEDSSVIGYLQKNDLRTDIELSNEAVDIAYLYMLCSNMSYIDNCNSE